MVQPMSAEAPALTRSFRVGHRTVTVTMPAPRLGKVRYMTIEWAPDPPRRLSKRELHQYRAGRNAAVAELAKLTGMKAAIIEI